MAKKKAAEMRTTTGVPATSTPVDVPANAEETLGRTTYHLPLALTEKVRDAAWWDRRSCNDIAKVALEQYIAALEKKRKAPYEPRGGAVRRGRSLG